MSAAAIHNRGFLHSTFYHLNTLYLFTADQFGNTVIPSSVFCILAAIPGPVLNLPSRSLLTVLPRLTVVWFWLWLVIMSFCVHN
jgi:hypothetical protein